MKIERNVIAQIDSPYATNVFEVDGEKRAIVASELKDKCYAFSPEGEQIEVYWENQGGSMNLCQLNDQGEFLAVQEFYQNFHSETAGIARVWKQDGAWQTRRYIDLPFVHRFCVQAVGDRQFVIACTIAKHKENGQDWSKPGAVYLGLLPKDLNEPCTLTPLIEGIYKNHGMYQGKFQGKDVVIITGQEGVFRIDVPATADGQWHYERMIEREVSDITVCDIDMDGQEELITIEGFHGHVIAVNKLVGGEWKIVSRYPVTTAHALWGGELLGKPCALVGYRGANAALLHLGFAGWKEGNMLLQATVIDQYDGPVNLAVMPGRDEAKIFNVSGTNNRIVHYTLKA